MSRRLRNLDDLEEDREGVAGGAALEAPEIERALELQRTAGNTAVAALLSRPEGPGGAAIHRLVDERAPTEAPEGEDEVAGAEGEEGAQEPQAQPGLFSRAGTWIRKKLKRPAVAPPKEKEDKPAHPPKAKLPMDLASGQKVLKDAFGTVKEIVPGKVEVLEEDAFKAAYDKIYGETEYSWDKYVVPKFGGLNGFAHKGVNYINKASAGLHTVAHEMLHNNTADDWRGVVGHDFDEGTTEVLTQEACIKAGEDAPTAYPGETPVVREAIAQGLSLGDLTEAYLKGGARVKVADWVDANCTEDWETIRGHMAAKRWAAAKAGLKRKDTAAKAEKAAK